MFGDGYGEAVGWDVVGVGSAAFEFGEVAELEGNGAGVVACGGGEGYDGGAGVVGYWREVGESKSVFGGDGGGGRFH